MTVAGSAVQYATFSVAGHFLGIDVLRVQEVLREQRLTPVPLAPDVVQGLINLRGQIVPALDMRRLLKLPAREDGAAPLSIVVHTAQGPVSLQVDEIGDVIHLDSATFQSAPENVDPGVRRLMAGVHKLKDRLLLVLDTARATEAAGAADTSANRSHHVEKAE